jgi:hypothetical protein
MIVERVGLTRILQSLVVNEVHRCISYKTEPVKVPISSSYEDYQLMYLAAGRLKTSSQLVDKRGYVLMILPQVHLRNGE